jgi:hypothetical protein
MSVRQGERAVTVVGLVTAVIGIVLIAVPRRSAELVGLDDADARALGVADLVLSPALLWGRPRWLWMAARAAMNLGMGAFVLRRGRSGGRARAFATLMLLLSTADTRVVLALRGAEAEPDADQPTG